MECWNTAVKGAWSAENPLLVVFITPNAPIFRHCWSAHPPLQPFYRQLPEGSSVKQGRVVS
jgi:hypothetical protein